MGFLEVAYLATPQFFGKSFVNKGYENDIEKILKFRHCHPFYCQIAKNSNGGLFLELCIWLNFFLNDFSC